MKAVSIYQERNKLTRENDNSNDSQGERPSSRPLRGLTNQEFQLELRQLKDKLLAMGARCEQMIARAERAFSSQDSELAREIFDADKQNNADEIAIDELAIRILALRQPLGRDLRFTVSAVKVVTDLERIGDEAVNLAERAVEMARKETLPGPSLELPQMARLAGQMLHDALDAFVEEDTVKAREVFAQDDAVDEIYGQTLRACLEWMRNNPDQIHGSLRVYNCARYLERIADHATNIAEMVIYLVDGVDVRHQS